LLLVLLPGECLHNAHRREHLLNDGEHFAFFLPNLAGGFLDAPGIGIDDGKQNRRDRQCDEREAPVQPEHDADHSHERENVNYGAEQTAADEALNIVDVTGHSADQVAGAILVVEGERQPLHVRVDRAAQIVGDPLPDAGGQVLFGIGRNRVENGDQQNGDAGELHGREFVGAEDVLDEERNARFAGASFEYFIEDDLQRPRLKQVGNGFAQDGEEPEDERDRMRLEQRTQREPLPAGRGTHQRLGVLRLTGFRSRRGLRDLRYLCQSGLPPRN